MATKFGPLEAAVMVAVWEAGGPLSVQEIRAEIRYPRPLAHTTVLTVAENLCRKGFLMHQKRRRGTQGPRPWEYSPATSREMFIARQMTQDLRSGGDFDVIMELFTALLTDPERNSLSGAIGATGHP